MKYECNRRSVTVLADDGFHIFGTVCGIPGVWHKDTGASYHCDTAPINEVKEPPCVPWTADDVPWPWPIIRSPECGPDHLFAITEVDRYGVVCGEDGLTYAHLMEKYEYTTDGKTWLPCRKEITK